MLDTRAIADELMDAADLDGATYARVLTDLARVNALTLARRPTLGFLKRLPRYSQPLRILDVGFGDGDMLRAIAYWALRNNRAVELIGVDLNPKSAPAAIAATPEALAINFQTGDYADFGDVDVIISSLVAHHMTSAELATFVRFMDRHARAGWFINDLYRHSFAYYGFPLLARMMRVHPIVRHDGQLSIARSYRPTEWPPILAAAAVTAAQVTARFPFRLCVSKFR